MIFFARMTLLTAVTVGVISCNTPQQPTIKFDDRPSSYGNVSGGTGAVANRQYLGDSGGFIAANEAHLNQAISDLSAADRVRAEERARRAAMASSSSSSSSGSSTVSRPASNDYENCVCTFDDKKGEVHNSGYNNIHFRARNGTWHVGYYFGSGDYLMSGSGNLEGRTIQVFFENGRPARMKCNSGSGTCSVDKSYRE